MGKSNPNSSFRNASINLFTDVLGSSNLSTRKKPVSPVISAMSQEHRSRKSMNWMLGFRAGAAKHQRSSGA